MEFLKLLSYICLILITAMTVRATENLKDNRQVRYNIDPFQYHIRLITNITENNVTFHGHYTVNMNILKATNKIYIHLMQMKINESAITLKSFKVNKTTIHRPTNYTYDQERDIVLLTFAEQMEPVFCELYVEYNGTSPINPTKFHKIQYTNKGGRVWVALMPFVPISTNGSKFPCWGKPAVTQRFSISIKHNHTFRALSNAPISKRSHVQNDMVWTYFHVTLPISTCQVAVVLTDFAQVHNENNSTSQVWCRSNVTSHMRYAQSIAEQAMERMVQYTAISDKIIKIDHIAIPNYSFQGLAYWGLILYNEADITYVNETDDSFRRKKIVRLITHEVSHQWFGCLVTPAYLPHSWLSEGIALYFQTHIMNEIDYSWQQWDFMVLNMLHGSLQKDIDLTVNSIIPQIFDSDNTETFPLTPIDNKAPVILRMLKFIITNYVFRIGIMRYLRRHQFGSVTSDDLWDAMQSSLDDSNILHKNFNVKEVMDPWIRQTHYPLVTVTRNYEIGEAVISQNQFCLHDFPNTDKKWWVPLTWTTQTNPNFYYTQPSHWLSPLNSSTKLLIHPNDWIIVNLLQTGYYRVNYDSTNWRKIAQYLNSDEYTKIHILNRAQIIDDACALMMRKQLDLSIFFELTNYLRRETNYVPLFPMFRHLVKLHDYFVLPESESLKTHISNILNEHVKRIGYGNDPVDDITKLKRMRIANWACLAGNLECKRLAADRLDQYLIDVAASRHEEAKRFPYWLSYCIGLLGASNTTWNRAMDLYRQNRDKIFLRHLACSENSDIIINYLNIIASGNLTLTNLDHVYAFNSIVVKNAHNNPVFHYMLENFETIKPELLTTVDALKKIIFNVYSREQLDTIKNFVRNNSNTELSAAILPIIDSYLIELANFIDGFPAQYKP